MGPGLYITTKTYDPSPSHLFYLNNLTENPGTRDVDGCNSLAGDSVFAPVARLRRAFSSHARVIASERVVALPMALLAEAVDRELLN